MYYLIVLIIVILSSLNKVLPTTLFSIFYGLCRVYCRLSCACRHICLRFLFMSVTAPGESKKLVEYLLGDLRQLSTEAKKKQNHVKEVSIIIIFIEKL